MKRFFIVTLAALATWAGVSGLLPAPSASAQWRTTLDKIAAGAPVSASVAADDTDVALLIKYVGAASTATVEVAVTSSDFTFKQGGAADTTLECPVSGALGGLIDVSNAACNTAGEVVDIINGSADWRAVILDGVRSDVVDARLLTLAESDATLEDGRSVFWDTSTAFIATRALTTKRTIKPYIAGRPQQNALFTPNPFAGFRTVYWYGNATSTYATGNSNFSVVCVSLKNNSGTTKSTETVTTILGPIAGGATTANKEFDFRHSGVYCDNDQKLLIRLTNSLAAATVQLVGYGTQYVY
jgi:hypothetical protein